MKEYLKNYASILSLFAVVLTLVTAFAFNIYLNSRDAFVSAEEMKFRSAVTNLERDIDDLKVQLDDSVLGLDRTGVHGNFEFYRKGTDLMAKHTQMAEREIAIQSDGGEPFAASIQNFLSGDYVLTNSRGESLSSHTKQFKFLTSQARVNLIQKKTLGTQGFLVLDASGAYLASSFDYRNFLKSTVLVWNRKIQGSDLAMVHAAAYPGFLPIFFSVLGFAALICVPFALALFVIRRRVARAYGEIAAWVGVTAESMRYGRPVELPTTRSVTRQALPLLTSIQDAFSKTSPLLSYGGGDFLSQEFNLVSWNHFKKTISLWLCGQSGNFDVENGKDWVVCSIGAVRDSVLDTFVREANGAMLSKKMFFYQYSDRTVLLALKVVDFEESLERIKALIKNAAAREGFAAHDIVVDAVYGSQHTSTFGDWFSYFESIVRAPTAAKRDEALISTEVVRFYMYASREKVLALNWIQLMAGVRNWLQLKAPEAESYQKAPGAAPRPRKFARPRLAKPGTAASEG